MLCRVLPDSRRIKNSVVTLDGYTGFTPVQYRLLELLMACERAGDEELLKIYSQAVQNWPEEADYDYLMGKYYVSRKDYRSAETHLSRALELLEKYGKAAKSAFCRLI